MHHNWEHERRIDGSQDEQDVATAPERETPCSVADESNKGEGETEKEPKENADVGASAKEPKKSDDVASVAKTTAKSDKGKSIKSQSGKGNPPQGVLGLPDGFKEPAKKRGLSLSFSKDGTVFNCHSFLFHTGPTPKRKSDDILLDSVANMADSFSELIKSKPVAASTSKEKVSPIESSLQPFFMSFCKKVAAIEDEDSRDQIMQDMEASYWANKKKK